jgi:hypothetical protein
MSAHEIKEVLLWCAVMNYALLFIWFGVFVLAHERIYHLYRRWFKLSVETFDAIHLAGIAAYKIGIILFNLIPLIAVCLLT